MKLKSDILTDRTKYPKIIYQNSFDNIRVASPKPAITTLTNAFRSP